MAEYRAVRRIEHNGVGAYNPGDPVDARVVAGAEDAAEGAWVPLEDVEPVNPPPPPPLKEPVKKTGSK